jgi:Lon protease-like protein
MALLPMFPLGTVLFPSAVLPLHVFEPRYRAMVRDCLAAERELGVVLIERGSEVGGGDVRSEVGTVAKLVEARELPDGRWALLAVGARRLRVEAWLPDDPYPVAEVSDWPDADPGPGHAEAVAAVVARLPTVLAHAAEAGDDAVPPTIELSDDPVLAAMQVAAVGPFGPFDRQLLLAAPTPDDRVARLGALLEDAEQVLRLRLSE